MAPGARSKFGALTFESGLSVLKYLTLLGFFGGPAVIRRP